MKTQVEVLLTPADLAGASGETLKIATCVVFDILRATSSIVTALHHGAREIVVVGEIEDALTLRAASPGALLAGERGGERIRASLSGSIDFHFGNSPREFTPQQVEAKVIAMTTTNGTRALRACNSAHTVLAGSFLNLSATADALCQSSPELLLLICAGTGRDASYEDVLGTGALLDLLPDSRFDRSTDPSQIAMELYEQASGDLAGAISRSRNGRRLAANSELCGDVAFCAQLNRFPHAVQVSNQIARLHKVS